MKYKKSFLIICLIICIFSIASLCASDVNETVSVSENQNDVVSVEEMADEVVSIENNVTNDVVSVEEMADEVVSIENDDLKMGSINHDDLSLVTCEDNNSSKEKLAKNQEDVLSKSESGPSGHIESKDVTLISKNPIGYKVRLVGENVANQEVSFEVLEFYDDKGGIQTYDYFDTVSDANGYATLKGYLPYGKYLIVTSTWNHGYVENYVTVKPNGYKDMYLNVDKTDKSIKYGWSGVFDGYLKIYKNNKLLKKIRMKTFDGRYDYWQNFNRYSIKKFSAGKYTVKIVNNKNKIIKKKSFTIKKSKKTSKKKKSSSKYKYITITAKKYYKTKKSGKYSIKTKIWDMWRPSIGHYKYIDTWAYKNGKLLPQSKYWVKFKIKGKWTGWKACGPGTGHNRYSAYYSSLNSVPIKVKIRK